MRLRRHIRQPYLTVTRIMATQFGKSSCPEGEMKELVKSVVALALSALLTTGCINHGAFPHTTGTTVDLSRNNYQVVRTNAIGSSSGFSFLGIIPIVSPTYTGAITDLYDDAGMKEGSAQALVNVTREESTVYLILFSLPSITVRADIIEFTDDAGRGSDTGFKPRSRRYPPESD